MSFSVAMNPDQISFCFALAGIVSGFVFWLIMSRF